MSELIDNLMKKINELYRKITSDDMTDVKLTIEFTMYALRNFTIPDRPEAYIVCARSLAETLERCDRIVSGYNSTSDEACKQLLLLELGKLDFLIKQKADQFIFLFGADANQPPVVKLTNDDVRKFWTISYGMNVAMVPWQEFLRPFVEATTETWLLENESNIKILAEFLDSTLDGWVSIYDLEVFLHSFGPLTGCIHRLLEPFLLGILAGFVTSHEATKLLENAPMPGAYLVRFSKSKPGTFAVTYVDDKRKVKHMLIKNAEHYGLINNQDPDTICPSLCQFVKAHEKSLVIPMGSSAERSRPGAHHVKLVEPQEK